MSLQLRFFPKSVHFVGECVMANVAIITEFRNNTHTHTHIRNVFFSKIKKMYTWFQLCNLLSADYF